MDRPDVPESQRFAIRGRIYAADDPALQDMLAAVHETPERPRCLCVAGGVEMYVAHHRHYLVKRMPESGKQHHPGCPSYAPDSACSGLGELLGDAVIETEPGRIELRVDFPWARVRGRSVPRGDSGQPAGVAATRHRMSLRAVTHYLFERAGFNRWTPAMSGRRNQAVLRKYLLEVAGDVVVAGTSLADRLYVPEPFNESTMKEAAQRRREKLSLLQRGDGQTPLALVIGEFKGCEPANQGKRVWIRHMPDAPLLVGERDWQRVERAFRPLFEAQDADTGYRTRLLMSALIRARRDFTYEIDSASLMLASEQWIPVEGVHEMPLIHALIARERRFIKPLRYDARLPDAFPNALLLDVGERPAALHVVSRFMDARSMAAKERAIADDLTRSWVWRTAEDMPALPLAQSGHPRS